MVSVVSRYLCWKGTLVSVLVDLIIVVKYRRLHINILTRKLTRKGKETTQDGHYKNYHVTKIGSHFVGQKRN